MTIVSNKYANRNLDLLSKLPDDLKIKLDEVSHRSYSELYESVINEEVSLKDSLEEILELLENVNPAVTHFQRIWMGIILAFTVKPTVKYYQPNNLIPDQTIDEMLNCLFNMKKGYKVEIQAVQKLALYEVGRDIDSSQTFHEALDVYADALKLLNPDRSLMALLDILETCLEGYAIFPGSDGRRDLLNWWLFDVVPATWHLCSPISIYLVDSLQKEAAIEPQPIKVLNHFFDSKRHSTIEINESHLSNSHEIPNAHRLLDSDLSENWVKTSPFKGTF